MADKAKKIVTAAAAGLLGISCGVNSGNYNDGAAEAPVAKEVQQSVPLSIAGTGSSVEIRGFDDRIQAINRSGSILWEISTDRPVTALSLNTSGQLLAGLENQILLIDSRKGDIDRRLPELGNNSLISSLSMSEDGIFAADRNNAVVYRFSSEGRLLSMIGKDSPDGIRIPGFYFSVSSAGDGKVWVSNPGHHKVEVYDLAGDYLGGFGTAGPEGFAGCCNPVSLMALSDGTVLAGEKGFMRVRRFDSNGVVVQWIAGGEGRKLSHLPLFLYGNDGDLIISDGRNRTAVEMIL